MKHSQASLSTAPLAAAALLPVAAPVETAHPKQAPERSRNKVIQTKHPVLGALERLCHPQVELAENLVFPLGKTAPESRAQLIAHLARTVEMHCHAESADGEILLPAARLAQSADKGKLHSFVRKPDCRLHAQCRRPRKAACKERGKPPVVLRNLDTAAVLPTEHKRAVQQFRVRRCLKPCRPVLLLSENPVRMVNADFAPGIDAILPFPELNQPCPAVIVKVHRQRIKNHLEARRHIIINPGIPRLPLPCVQRA